MEQRIRKLIEDRAKRHYSEMLELLDAVSIQEAAPPTSPPDVGSGEIIQDSSKIRILGLNIGQIQELKDFWIVHHRDLPSSTPDKGSKETCTVCNHALEILKARCNQCKEVITKVEVP